jgi:hypothetical protein
MLPAGFYRTVFRELSCSFIESDDPCMINACYKYLYLFICLPLALGAQTNPVALTVNQESYHEVSLESAEGVYEVKTTGKDPYIFTNPLQADLDVKNTQLSFEYFCPTGVDFIEVYFYPLQEPVSPIMIRDVGSTEGWVEFRVDISEKMNTWGKKGDWLRLDFGAAPDLYIQLKNIRLRPMTQREQEIQQQKTAKKMEEAVLEANIGSYLQNRYAHIITQVELTENSVQIKGETAGKGPLFLAEISPYEHLTQQTAFEFLVPIRQKNKTFSLKLDRMVERHGILQDRLLSKWVIVEKRGSGYAVASHARYADNITPKYNDAYVQPATKKGLGGYSAGREAPVSDLDSLGIGSVTVNIWINQLYRSEASAGHTAFTYQGRTYYVDTKELQKLDETLLSTAARNIEVSAILLVGKADNSPDKTIGKLLQHPDMDPAGIYSMPNVTSPEGVQYYSAILDFLAARYSRPDQKWGRIHHYIIHNEVDAGWVWTNAGEKTALVFMDLYHKSMRMTYNIARSYNPHAKVFISLTHYWNWTSNPRFYHSKDLLEQLLAFSGAEGDFEWAIAQHPYPESLREPKVWLDKKVSFDYETPLITFKNIEVLDAWVQQPEVLYKGKHRRTVYLSENGTNSPTYSEQDLTEQAAGMAYALKKIKYLKGIDGFQYHNWQDNRREGGLRIGLRRFPDDRVDPGGKKRVWFVYQAFDTEEEDKVFEPYKAVIGIDSWDEIRHKARITTKAP